jgi:hypothetical protein
MQPDETRQTTQAYNEIAPEFAAKSFETDHSPQTWDVGRAATC